MTSWSKAILAAGLTALTACSPKYDDSGNTQSDIPTGETTSSTPIINTADLQKNCGGVTDIPSAQAYLQLHRDKARNFLAQAVTSHNNGYGFISAIGARSARLVSDPNNITLNPNNTFINILEDWSNAHAAQHDLSAISIFSASCANEELLANACGTVLGQPLETCAMPNDAKVGSFDIYVANKFLTNYIGKIEPHLNGYSSPTWMSFFTLNIMLCESQGSLPLADPQVSSNAKAYWISFAPSFCPVRWPETPVPPQP